MGLRTTIGTAIADLHRVHWFFLGFASGREPGRDETAGQHLAAQAIADNVREWMAGIFDGNRRTLAPGRVVDVNGAGIKVTEERHDGGLIVITYAELERIIDGLPKDYTRQGSRRIDRRFPEDDDMILAAGTAQRILREFQAEAGAYLTDDEIPF